MSENWQAGDLAMCTYQGAWYAISPWGIRREAEGPRTGQILTVRSVSRSYSGNLCLLFSDFPDPILPGIVHGYRAIYFRKVTPPEADEFDREIIAAMTDQPEQVPA